MPKSTNMSRRRAAAAEDNSPFYQEKRKAIISAAAKVFQRHGYEAATFAQIAEESESDRATLYYYASSKQEFFEEVIRQASEKNLEAVEKIVLSNEKASSKLRAALAQLLDSYNSDYPYLHVFLQRYLQSVSNQSDTVGNQTHDWAARYYSAIRSILQQGVETGEFDFDLPVGIVTISVIGTVNWLQATGVTDAKRREAAGEKGLMPDAMGAGLGELLLKGLLKR
jgi:TetR/AcrR family transcriptional regulator, cholesterol catabolism regulator